MEAHNYKATLDEIEAGDIVVAYENGWNAGYRLVKVDRVTKTQITIGSKKFNHRGSEIGSGSKWRRDYIHAPLDTQFSGRTMLEVAEADQAERIEKARRTELTKSINEKLGSASIEALEKIAELLT